jgi:dihydrolipoamide dehydrogenase
VTIVACASSPCQHHGLQAVPESDGENPSDLVHRDRMPAGWKEDGQVEWLRSAGIGLLAATDAWRGRGSVRVAGAETAPARQARAAR